MANLSLPPFLAWPGMPAEFVRWFHDSWVALIQNIADIKGANTSLTTLQGSVNTQVTNLSTLQTQANAISAAQVADAVNITALQTRATADEAAMMLKANNLSDVANAATARTNLGLGSGLSVTITLAKLTSGGANGSATFVNGILTAKVDPT